MFPVDSDNEPKPETETNMKLTKGQKYDESVMTWIGWSDGDGSGHDGYNVGDYFEADGTYRGADENGIEPLFEDLLR